MQKRLTLEKCLKTRCICTTLYIILCFDLRAFGSAGAEGSPVALASAEADGDVSGAAASVQLPYRMVFAVATMSSVVLYDSQVRRVTADVGFLHVSHVPQSRS